GEHAGQDFDRVRLLALRGVARLAGPPPVEIGLDVGFAERDARRRAVDDAAERRPMALAEGRHPKKMAESVVGHAFGPVAACRSPRHAARSNRARDYLLRLGACVLSPVCLRNRACPISASLISRSRINPTSAGELEEGEAACSVLVA